jgi:DNA-binding transcriptional ArsR family regulator
MLEISLNIHPRRVFINIHFFVFGNIVLQIPQSTVSRYLAGLRHAGLVVDCRNGNKIIYSLAATGSPQIAAIYDLLEKSCPCDEVMKADILRLKRAVQIGKCRLDQHTVPRKLPVPIVEKRF